MSAVLDYEKDTKPFDNDFVKDYEKIIDLTTLSMDMYAHIYYKNFSYLEPIDIDQIKKSLNKFISNNNKTLDFKNELMDDLTAFQQQIKENQINKISEIANQKLACEKRLKFLNVQKQEYIINRLSCLKWPFDNEYKKYNAQISELENKSKYNTNKMIYLQKLRPSADEKDILLYKMHLKEKFVNAQM